jgi:hypothetical protein
MAGFDHIRNDNDRPLLYRIAQDLEYSRGLSKEQAVGLVSQAYRELTASGSVEPGAMTQFRLKDHVDKVIEASQEGSKTSLGVAAEAMDYQRQKQAEIEQRMAESGMDGGSAMGMGMPSPVYTEPVGPQPLTNAVGDLLTRASIDEQNKMDSFMGYGRVGPYWNRGNQIQYSEHNPTHYGDNAFVDAVGAFIARGLDSATMGLWGLGTKMLAKYTDEDALGGLGKWFDANEAMWQRMKTTETTAGAIAGWGGELAGFFAPTGAAGLAAKGVRAAGKGVLKSGLRAAAAEGAAAGAGGARRAIGRGIDKVASGLEAIDNVTVTSKVFRTANKITGGIPSIKAASAIKGKLGKGVESIADMAGLDTKVKQELVGEAKKHVGGALRAAMERKRLITPDLLRKGVTKDVQDTAKAVFEERLTKGLMKRLGPNSGVTEGIVKGISEDLAQLVAANSAKTGAELGSMAMAKLLGQKASSKFGAAIGRMVEIQARDSLGVAMNGTMSRVTSALSEPVFYGLDEDASLKDMGEAALKFAISGDPTTWDPRKSENKMHGIVGDVWYGGIIGGAGIWKAMVPALGRRSNPSVVRAFKKFVVGPEQADRKSIKEFLDTVGEEQAKALGGVVELLPRGGQSKRSILKNPLKLFHRVKPNLRSDETRPNDVIALGEQFVKFLARNNNWAGDAVESELRGKLAVLRSGLGKVGPDGVFPKGSSLAEVQKSIVGILEKHIEDTLKLYRRELGINLAKDLAKNALTGTAIAVFSGKELYEGWKAGNVNIGNIMTHMIFSQMAAADPFFNAGHAWGKGWQHDRKKWEPKIQERLGKDARRRPKDAAFDPNELPGHMGSVVYMHRLTSKLRALGIHDADYVSEGPSRQNALWARSAKSGSMEEIIKKTAARVEAQMDANFDIKPEAEVEILASRELAAKARSEGRRAVAVDEAIETARIMLEASSAGVDVGEIFDIDGKSLMHQSAADMFGAETNRGKVALATLEMRNEAINRGIIDAADTLHGNHIRMLVANDAVRLGGAIANLGREVASSIRGTQSGAIGADYDAPLKNIELINVGDDTTFYQSAARFNNMIDAIGYLSAGGDRDGASPQVLDMSKPEDVSTLQVLMEGASQFENGINKLIDAEGEDGISLLDADLPEFLSLITEAHAKSIAPAMLIFKNRFSVGDEARAFDFDSTIIPALLGSNLIQRDPNFKPKKKGQKLFMIFRPDYEALNLTDHQRAQLDGLIKVLAASPEFRLVSGENANDRIGLETLEKLWSPETAFRHPDQDGKEFVHKNGLFGMFEEVGLHFGESGLVDSYMRNVSEHVNSKISESTMDFYNNIMIPNGWVVTLADGSRKVALPVELLTLANTAVTDGTLDQADIIRAFGSMLSTSARQGYKIQSPFSTEHLEILHAIIGELTDAGLIDGTAEARKTINGNELTVGDGLVVKLFDGPHGQHMLERVFDALQAYQMRHIEGSMDQLRGDIAHSFREIKDNLPPDDQEAQIGFRKALEIINGLMDPEYGFNRARSWRMLLHVLRDTGLVTIGKGGMKIQLVSQLDMKKLGRIIRFVDEWNGGDTIAAYLAAEYNSVEAAMREADRLFGSSIHQEPEIGTSLNKLLEQIGINDLENIEALALQVKARRDQEEEEWIAGGRVGRRSRGAVDFMRNTLLEIAQKHFGDQEGLDQAQARINELQGFELLATYNNLQSRRPVNVLTYGEMTGMPREAGLDGGSVPDVDKNLPGSYRTEKQNRNWSLPDMLMHDGKYEIWELASKMEMRNGQRSFFHVASEAVFEKVLADLFSGKFAHLERTRDGKHTVDDHRPVGSAGRFVATVMGDLDRILLHKLLDGSELHELPDGTKVLKAHEHANFLEEVVATYRGSRRANVDTLVDFIDRYIKILRDQDGSDGQMERLNDFYNENHSHLRSTYYLVSYDGFLGGAGGIEAIRSQGKDKAGFSVIKRVHQAYAKSSKHTDQALFAEAADVARTMLAEERDEDGQPTRTIPLRGVDLDRGKIRILITPDTQVHDAPVTFMDSHSVISRDLMTVLAVMNGYDVRTGDYGSIKASLFQRNGGANSDSNLITKTLMSVNPDFNGILEANDVAMVISESAAKVIFGDYKANLAEFELSDEGTAAGMSGHDMRDVLADNALNGNSQRVTSSNMVMEIDINALRFQQMVHPEVTRGSVSWQIENWMTPEFSAAMSEKYMRGDGPNGLQNIVGRLQGDMGIEQNAFLKHFFNRTDEDRVPGELLDVEEQFAAAVANSSEFASPHMLTGRRKVLGTIKRKFHEDMIFKGKTRFGSTRPMDPDYHDVLGAGDNILPHFMATRQIDLREIEDDLRIGIKRYSLVDGDDYSGVDNAQAEQFQEQFAGRGNHYNSAARGQNEITERKTSWVDYRAFGKGENGALYRGLEEYILSVARGGSDSVTGSRAEIGNQLLRLLEVSLDGVSDPKARKARIDRALDAAKIINDVWVSAAASGSDGREVSFIANSKKLRDLASSMQWSRDQLDVVRTHLIDSLSVLYVHSENERGSLSSPMVTLGSLHNSFNHLFGVQTLNDARDSKGQRVRRSMRGYEYEQRWKRRGREHQNTMDGLTPVTFGILGFAQRSPANRPNDTVPIHILGFHGRERGNAFTSSFHDAVRVQEADFDKDISNYWFDMPTAAAGEIMAIRNISGTLAPNEGGTMAGFDILSVDSEGGRKGPGLSGDHNFRYAQEQHHAVAMRGMLVKAQKTMFKALVEDLKVAYMDASGNLRVVRAIASTSGNETEGRDASDQRTTLVRAMEDQQQLILEMNKMVQDVIDSKSGMLPKAFKIDDFNAFRMVFEKMFTTYKEADAGSGARRPESRDALNAKDLEFLLYAMTPYMQAQRASGAMWQGEQSLSMPYEQSAMIASQYYDIMDMGRDGAGAPTRRAEYARILASGKARNDADREMIKSLRIEADSGAKTSVENMTKYIVKADQQISSLSGFDHFFGRSMRNEGKTEALRDAEFTKGEQFLPKFIGTRRELEGIIERLMAMEAQGDDTVGAERVFRQRQLDQMVEAEDTGSIYQRLPSNRTQAQVMIDNTIFGYAHHSAMEMTPDLDINNAATREGVVQVLQSALGKLRRSRAKQLKGEMADVNSLVTEDYIASWVEGAVARHLSTFARDENAVRVILELVSPRETGEFYRTRTGEPMMAFKPVQVEFLRAAYKIMPTETMAALKTLTTNIAAMEQIFSGDPGGLLRMRDQKIQSQYENFDMGIKLRRRRASRVNARNALNIAQRLLLDGDGGHGEMEKLREEARDELLAEGKRVPIGLIEKDDRTSVPWGDPLTSRLSEIRDGDTGVDSAHSFRIIQNQPTITGDYIIGQFSWLMRDPRLSGAGLDEALVQVVKNPRRSKFKETLQTKWALEAERRGDAKKANTLREAENRFKRLSRMAFKAMENDFLQSIGRLPSSDVSNSTIGNAILNQLRDERSDDDNDPTNNC